MRPYGLVGLLSITLVACVAHPLPTLAVDESDFANALTQPPSSQPLGTTPTINAQLQ